MLLMAALGLLVLSVLWYVGLARLRATEWTRRSGAMVPPAESPSAMSPPPPFPAGTFVPPPIAPPPGVAPAAPRLLEPEPAAPRSLEPEPAAAPEGYQPPPTTPLPTSPGPVPLPPSPSAVPPVAAPAPGYGAPPSYGPPPLPPPGVPPPAMPAPAPGRAPGARTAPPPTPPRRNGLPRLALPDFSRLFAGRRAVAADPEALLTAETAAPPVVPNYAYPLLIDREFRVDYTRRVYVNQACYVIVRVGPAGHDLPPLTPAEVQVLVATPSQRLRFAAQEEEPRVEVAIQFAEGTFYAARTTAEGVLHRDRESRFVFVVKPLKAEDCVLNIIVSYVEAAGEPELVAQRLVIERTIRTPDGQERQEHEEQTTYTPATTSHRRVVLTTERVIGVKSLLRLNTGELGLVQKGAGVVLTSTLLVMGAQNGQPFDPLYLIMSVAPLLGIPLGEAAQKLLERPGAG